MWAFFIAFSPFYLFSMCLLLFLLFCLHSLSHSFWFFFHFPFCLYYFLPAPVFLNHYLFRGRKDVFSLYFCFSILLNSLSLVSFVSQDYVILPISPLCNLKEEPFPEFLVFCASSNQLFCCFFYQLVTSSSASFQ